MLDREKALVLWFDQVGIVDVSLVGGKNASLGEMYSNLTPLGIAIPNGFAVTAYAYRHFLEKAGITDKIQQLLKGLDTHNLPDLERVGEAVRNTILKAKLPEDLNKEILEGYKDLSLAYGEKNVDVAVRSSATAEDLPGASFAGEQETYLNISGNEDLLFSVKRCFASLFTNRAISYRHDKGFDGFNAALSVTVQKMVRSDLACSGVMFTLDTETGFEDVVVINASYGLGEMIVQGAVTPDEFVVFKPGLKAGLKAIIGQDLGKKDHKMIYAAHGIKKVAVSSKEQEKFCLTDEEVLTLAKWGVQIEEYFSKKVGHYQPMDMEWAKDGKTNKLFIVQARPETIHAGKKKDVYVEYKLLEQGKRLTVGTAIGTKLATGPVRIIRDVKNIHQFEEGEILVTEITDPDWEPIMKIASAIITDKGGRTSHAAIVSRELGIPAIVGTENSTRVLNDKQMVTVDCSGGKEGVVYEGKLKFKVIEHQLSAIPETRTKVMVNIGSPDEAFKNHFLPVKGVGLGRLEFIIASHLQVHPNALIDYHKLKSIKTREMRLLCEKIDELTEGYKEKTDYYVSELAEGVGKITAAFWPNPVIIRFSDFKTNEYSTLLGGSLYEPLESNPMIGWRGTSRYYDPKFKVAFGLECKALLKVRKEFGLTNLIPMLPFCRTLGEAQQVLDVMKEFGLSKENDPTLKIYMMCEIPSNVILADQFLDMFDGMSIGSNDLTQLTLGLDRDAGTLAHIGNEKDEAVKELIRQTIRKCKARGKYVGICGQAPSDFPDFCEFLVEEGIESISLNPDTVVKTLSVIAEKERK
ncbi:MAG: phosphoenolpyruvate synthase [bacterium]|nr:phosphoenolpyruvate synthase [bacterium]